ncbi:hypothetical protein AJ80_03884 [Polytolypa hystricis UAMH7299]|uniref:RTA1 domain-containing protein n=1 Tax=Polytolypa hystricis (strain UAMH7299) TaxID=1447883 RepID=A0A2B7YF64_POLH7|nr:hypothetical protein AJ80_03884 [Polytolypa hystricis UAMH7299]
MAESADGEPFKYDFVFYRYDPSLAAAVLFTVLFGLTTLYHGYQLTRARLWYFIPLLVGGIFEVVGYMGRAISSTETPDWALGAFIMQSLTLLLAPAFFAASIYMALGRIILVADGEDCSLIPKKWLTKIFVAGDVLSFVTQGAGGGILATGKSLDKIELGERVIIGGLMIQVVFFGVFTVVSIVFHVRIRARVANHPASLRFPWAKHQYVLYITSILVLIRSVFRVIEYVQGNAGYLLSHEVFLYVFDGVLMLAVMGLFNVVHPSEVQGWLLQKDGAESGALEQGANGEHCEMVDR